VTLPASLDELDGLRAARWIRESTRGQFDNFGPDAQRDQQDRAIERYGLVDSGIAWQVAHSGRTIGNTRDFAEMLRRAGHDFDVLVVGYVSRFTRDLRTAVNARHDFYAAGAVLLFCDERVLSSDESSWEQWAREAVEAEAYSHRLAKRIREGYDAKFRRLSDQAGTAPLGLRRSPATRTLEIDPLVIGKVVDIFERYAAGTCSYQDLADAFELHADHVRAILDNPVYNGWSRRYRRSRHELRSPAPWRANPPVSDELWERVMLVRSRRLRGRPIQRRGYDPLGGLLYCRCGRRIRANGMSGNPPHRKRLHPGRCALWGDVKSARAVVHDDPIYAQVSGLDVDDSTIERVVRLLRQGEPEPIAIDRARLERQKRELALDHAAGRVGDDEYIARMNQLRTATPEPTQTSDVDPADAVAMLRNIAALWGAPGVSDEARGQLLHAIYDEITVTQEGVVSVRLTDHAYRYGMDVALPQGVLARPAGFQPGTKPRRVMLPAIVGSRARRRALRTA
jgi:DNA invertase Pin-like site-specific DNA recombinase